MTNVNFLPKSSRHNQDERLWELKTWSQMGKCFDRLWKKEKLSTYSLRNCMAISLENLNVSTGTQGLPKTLLRLCEKAGIFLSKVVCKSVRIWNSATAKSWFKTLVSDQATISSPVLPFVKKSPEQNNKLRKIAIVIFYYHFPFVLNQRLDIHCQRLKVFINLCDMNDRYMAFKIEILVLVCIKDSF